VVGGPGGGQRIWGNQNVQIVRAVNSHIEISYKDTTRRVPLEPAVLRPAERSRSPARLLRARSGVIPFAARRTLCDELVKWCHSDGRFAARVVAGPGGVGKTRLGVELCVEASGSAWLAGLLRSDVDQAGLEALAAIPTARLVVVDYAETRVEHLALLLSLLAEQSTEQHPVRVLLLVRSPPRRTGVWTEALEHHSDELDSFVDAMDVDVLADAPLSEPERRELFMAAATGLVRWVKGATPVAEPPALLDGPTFASPLLVVVAAYLALHNPEQIPTSRRGLLDELLVHEDRYWRHTGGPDDAVLRRRVVALATLAGAADETDAAHLLSLVPDLADSSGERRRVLARWAHRLYDGPRWWNPLEPDLLAEHLVSVTYQNHPDVLAGVLIDRSAEAVIQPLDLYVRAHPDHPDLVAATATLIGTHLPDLCRLAVEQAANGTSLDVLISDTTLGSVLTRAVSQYPPKPEILPDLLAALPQRADIVLTPLGAELTLQHVDRLRRLAMADPAVHLPNLGSALTNLSNRHAELGRHIEGLATIQDAIHIFRHLAGVDTIYLPDLARALDNESNQLDELGQYTEALAASEEAVSIHRQLAAASRGDHRAGLAPCLSNLAIRLYRLGRNDEGLAASREAVELYRQLADAHPEVLPELAVALSNLSNHLGPLGQENKGLAAAQEAVTIHRHLARTTPAAHTPNLAMLLHSLAVRLGAVGRYDEGIAAAQEAVELYRQLASANSAYRVELAMTLNNLSTLLGSRGRHQEGLTLSIEAVETFQELVATHEGVLPDFAASTFNMSMRLGGLGRFKEEVAAAQEGVKLYKRLVHVNPAAHRPRLVVALMHLSVRLYDLGRHDEALVLMLEAVERRGQLVHADLAANPTMAKTLQGLDDKLAAAGRSIYRLVPRPRAQQPD
jgi:tetratricopeptide (TPR) repeat protein